MGKVVQLFDGLMNALTGRGTGNDKRMHGRYAQPCVMQDQIDASYRTSWLHRKCVDVPVGDMIREWRDWQGEGAEIAKIEAEEKRLKVKDKIREVLTYGRLGGGAIYIGIKGDMPSEPLDTSRKNMRVDYLAVLSRWQLTLGQENMDPASPMFGEPDYFTINTNAKDAGVQIHPSRIVPSKGMFVPNSGTAQYADRYWGDALWTSIGDAVQNADATQVNFASLIEESTYDVIGIPGLTDILSVSDGESKIIKRLEASRVGKSIHRAIVLDAGHDGKGGETWETRQLTLTGMPEVTMSAINIVAGAADIPVTRLFGTSAKGLGATGKGDERDYLSGIAMKQETILRPALDRIDAAVLAGIGISNGAWYEFAPLFELDEVERAALNKTKAETVNIYVNTGIVPVDALGTAVANMLVEDGTYPGLGDAMLTPAPAYPVEPDDLVIVTT